MGRRQWIAALTLILTIPFAASAQEAGDTTYAKGRVTIMLELGVGDKEPTAWDGSVTVEPGEIAKMERWAFRREDVIEGNTWKLSSYIQPPRIQWMKKRVRPSANAVLITLAEAGETSAVSIETVQGNFQFTLAEVPYGVEKRFLEGKVRVARVPSVSMAVSAPTEDDYPSAALGPDGTIYVAYTTFTHGKGFEKTTPITEEPKNFSYLGAPTGGDRVMLTSLQGGKWSEPVPVTPGGEDLFKTATAVDGEGRVWVFWSRNVDGNWDLFARFRKGEIWSQETRLTDDPGPDINPVAVTDSTGRVWVAWQGARDGSFDILAAGQEGEQFGEAIVVGRTPANQWDPAIAASKDGAVAVAWDTYAKGDYDIYCCIWRDGAWGEPIPVAVSPRFEARAAVAYDGDARLWIAYEDGPERWGKDWGRVERTGSGLYQGRSVDVRVLADGRLHRPSPRPEGKPAFANSAMPVLGTDATGRVWVGIRRKEQGFWPSVGSTWMEYVSTCTGKQWLGDTVVPHTDGLLDNRPVLLSAPTGGLALIGSSDLRQRTCLLAQKAKKTRMPLPRPSWPDPVNNELFMADFNLGEAGLEAPYLEPVAPGEPPAMGADTEAERGDVRRMREYRTTLGGRALRILRGEFHRHTEISWDGGGDGALMDMWRYGIDAAGMDWIGNGDHDWGNDREYPWWIVQKETDVFHIPGAFATMFSYERSCSYPDGHRNPMFAQRGVRSLARLQGGRGKAMDDQPDATPPPSPDTQMLYKYLRQFNGITAVHTSATNHGTDWRDNDPAAEPIVEIYQGCRLSSEKPDGPRTFNAENEQRAGFRPLGFVSNALLKGYRLGFQASSDHGSTHISYCNVWVDDVTREAILDGMKRRHVYGATDNILADVRCNGHFMGDEFETNEQPTLEVKLVGTKPFANVKIIRDNEYVYTVEPKTAEVEFKWTDTAPKPGTVSYYYVRGLQEDEEVVWVSPMWIKYVPAK